MMAEAKASLLTPKKVGVKGKIIHSQGREIIANILKFMKEEAGNNTPTIPLCHYRERLLAATGISDSTYRSIVKEVGDIDAGRVTSFSSPGKKRSHPSPKSTLRTEEKQTIRTIVHNFYIHERRRPTIRGIYDKILENGIPFEGGLTTLSNVLKKMGFRWQKTADKGKLLMESYDIRAKRIKYLRQLQSYLYESRPIVFTDESYIHSSHTQPKEWSNDTILGLKKPTSKGSRLIMVH